MKARLLKDQNGEVKVLNANGTISNSSTSVLVNFLKNFKNAADFDGKDGEWNTNYRDMSLYPGETLAYIDDGFALVILDFSEFQDLINEPQELPNYISLVEYAKRVDKSVEIIKVFCRDNRIAGARKIANRWMIPEDAPYPVAPKRRRDDLKDMKTLKEQKRLREEADPSLKEKSKLNKKAE